MCVCVCVGMLLRRNCSSGGLLFSNGTSYFSCKSSYLHNSHPSPEGMSSIPRPPRGTNILRVLESILRFSQSITILSESDMMAVMRHRDDDGDDVGNEVPGRRSGPSGNVL